MTKLKFALCDVVSARGQIVAKTPDDLVTMSYDPLTEMVTVEVRPKLDAVEVRKILGPLMPPPTPLPGSPLPAPQFYPQSYGRAPRPQLPGPVPGPIVAGPPPNVQWMEPFDPSSWMRQPQAPDPAAMVNGPAGMPSGADLKAMADQRLLDQPAPRDGRTELQKLRDGVSKTWGMGRY